MHVSRKFSALWGAAIAFSLVASPAAAQRVSDGYAFLKAVKDRDGAAATNLVATPGSVIIKSTARDTGDGALHIIVRERDLTWLGFLLGKDARVDLQNDQGDTPLALAAQIGWVEGAQVLLGTRASVDLANNRGETPLILAVHRRDLPMVRLLVGAGANPAHTDNVAGYSALDYAKRDSRSAGIVRLLEEGATKPKREVSGPVL